MTLEEIEAELASPCNVCHGEKKISKTYARYGVNSVSWQLIKVKCPSCKGTGLARDQRVFTFSKKKKKS